MNRINDLNFSSGKIGSLDLYLAKTPLQRRLGLGGLTHLNKDGMLFIYEHDVSTPFTMGPMEFPLRIIFIAWDGNIVKDSIYPKTYSSPVFAGGMYQLVLETPIDVVYDPVLIAKEIAKKYGRKEEPF